MSEVVRARESESAMPTVAALEADGIVETHADCSPEQQAELRYLAALETLVADALDHQHTEVLVDVLTWYLARIGFGFGVQALGDIVRRLGAHVGEIAERQAAAREAKAAKKSGRAPH
jgi:hypothetical protein